MSLLSASLVKNRTFKNAKELSPIKIGFSLFQNNPKNLDSYIYFGNSNYTIANVASGTSTRIIDTTPCPSVGDSFYSQKSADRVRPLIVSNANRNLRLNSTAASDGSTISGFRTTISENGFLRLLFDGTSTANTTIVLTNPTGGTLTFTAIAGMINAENLEIVLPLFTGTASAFTYTNGFATVSSITITMSSSGQPDFKVIEFGNNVECFTGAYLNYQVGCVDSMSQTLETTINDILCYSFPEDSTATEQTYEFEIVVNDTDPRLKAVAFGQSLKAAANLLAPVVLNAPVGGQSNQAIATGTLTLATGLDTLSLRVNIKDIPVTQVSNVAQVTANFGNVYHYNSTSGVFTFQNTSEFNGQVPTIIATQASSGTFYEVIDRDMCPFGVLVIPRVNDLGQQEIVNVGKVRITGANTTQEDNNTQTTYNFRAYFYNDGTRKKLAEMIYLG